MYCKTKRYAYYFDGVKSYCDIPYKILANDGDYFSLCFKSEATELNYAAAFVVHDAYISILAKNNLVRIDPAGGQNNPFYQKNMSGVIKLELIYANGGMVVRSNGEENTYSTAYRVAFSRIGLRTSGDRHWKGYIYGFALGDAQMRQLEDYPNIKFHNVVRYEVDRNGNIIESTATLLNT